MKFKIYLNEGRTKTVSKDEALDFLKNKANDAFKLWAKGDKGNNRIFRGKDDWNNFGIVDPKKSSRESRNTRNHYTLIIDNTSKWKAYPKRSQSIVCSSNWKKSNAYGVLFHVFPENGSKIGICPDSDIWSSFKTMHPAWANAFNEYVPMLLSVPQSAYGRKWKYSDWDNDWSTLKKGMTEFDKWFKLAVEETMKFDKEDAEEQGEKYTGTKESATESMKEIIPSFWDYRINNALMDKMIEEYDGNFQKMVEKFLDPQKNGFKLVKAGQTTLTDRELWTDGKSLMIEDSTIKKIDTDLRRIAKELMG